MGREAFLIIFGVILFAALLAGIIGVAFKLNGMKLNDVAKAFGRGAADLLGAALCVGMAQGIVIVLGGTDPTSGRLLGALAAKLDWGDWAKFQIKFQGILVIFASLAMILAVVCGLS